MLRLHILPHLGFQRSQFSDMTFIPVFHSNILEQT